MWTLFLQTLKDRRRTIFWFSVSAALLVWMFVALYPSIEAQADQLNEAFSSYPKEFLQAFGIDELNLSKLENYLAAEQYSFTWPMLVLFLMATMAGPALAGEIERGTADILLARRLSRIKIYWSRYLTAVSTLFLFVIFSNFTVIPFALLHGVAYQLDKLILISVLGFLFGLATLGVGFALSAWFSERSRVYMLLGVSLVGMYVLNIVAQINPDTFDWVKYFSFFYYFDANLALVKGQILAEAYWFFGAISISSALLGVWRFRRRDIS
ncbi:MAG: ABC transporter permease [Candidatus Nomurabacteria bacterium]|nr:MAG: ABC transporter permease [Candidatus Nomurabacteria bacterium]